VHRQVGVLRRDQVERRLAARGALGLDGRRLIRGGASGQRCCFGLFGRGKGCVCVFVCACLCAYALQVEAKQQLGSTHPIRRKIVFHIVIFQGDSSAPRLPCPLPTVFFNQLILSIHPHSAQPSQKRDITTR
jgi:hypothetical protein